MSLPRREVEARGFDYQVTVFGPTRRSAEMLATLEEMNVALQHHRRRRSSTRMRPGRSTRSTGAWRSRPTLPRPPEGRAGFRLRAGIGLHPGCAFGICSRVVELRAGVRLSGYTLVTPLGEGGQAAVWKAIDPQGGGAVRALKVYQLRGSSPESAERARREAKTISQLRHPGVLACDFLIEDQREDLVLLVFDYVHGRSLADALTDTRMTAAHRRAAVVQLAETLAHVHGQGVAHRDVKPDNVLVTEAFWDTPSVAGTLKLVDFGIAAPAGNPRPLTREGGVVGTTPYLPPELVDTNGLFEPGDDLRRDVFAFGVLAWEVLVGGHPTGLPLGASRDAFAGVYLAARAGKRVWPPEAPPMPELATVRACLAFSAAARPASCSVVAEALREGAPEQTQTADIASARTSGTGQPGEGGPPRISRTDIHVPPGVTRPPQATGPAWAPQGPAHVMTGRIPSVVTQPAAAPGDRSPGKGCVIAILAALLLLGAIAVGVYLVVNKASPEPLAPQTPLPSPRPTAQAPVVAAPQAACCFEDGRKCSSGRVCKPGPCKLLADGPWRLRVINAEIIDGQKTTKIPQEWRSSFICLKNTRTGEEECASANTMSIQGSDATHRVTATIADMQNGRIRVRVVDGGVERVNAPGFSSPTGFKATALCSNITLHLDRWEPHNGWIAVYLDDP